MKPYDDAVFIGRYDRDQYLMRFYFIPYFEQFQYKYDSLAERFVLIVIFNMYRIHKTLESNSVRKIFGNCVLNSNKKSRK